MGLLFDVLKGTSDLAEKLFDVSVDDMKELAVSETKKRIRRTDQELENDSEGEDRDPRDFDYATSVMLSQAKRIAPSQPGVYILFLNGKVMKCGRAAYGQGIKWRFTQYYNLNYDDKARQGDYWSVSPENRDLIVVSGKLAQ